VTAPISVQFDAVRGLAERLAGLAEWLSEQERSCATAAASSWAALEGAPGFWASSTGTAWAGVLRLIEERCSALAGALAAAVGAYHHADQQLSAELAGLPVARQPR
jgi:hypothetical protein